MGAGVADIRLLKGRLQSSNRSTFNYVYKEGLQIAPFLTRYVNEVNEVK